MATNKCVFKFALNEHTIKVFETNLFSILSCFLMGDYVEKHACMHAYNVVHSSTTTDKETDESWDICIYNMKNQFWAGLGSRASTVKKFWGRL